MMNIYGGGKKRTKMKVVAREVAVKTGQARRFQAELEPTGVLDGETLIEELAKYGYANERVRAELAMTILDGFIVAKLAEGYRIDTGLVSFVPRLSGALSTRDVDPETDGLYVQGSVTARAKLRHALRDKIEAVNPLARRNIRIFNVYDTISSRFDEIAAGHELSVSGQDIFIDPASSDEGVWLEKRSGHWGKRPKFIQRAEVLESKQAICKVVFREPIPRGQYNIVISTRCGDGHDYNLRRIGHPVRVV